MIEEIRPPCTFEVVLLKQKQSYFRHIICAENISLEKQTMLDMIKGRRGRGRPCMCHMSGVKAVTKLYLAELWEAVHGRDVWITRYLLL